MIIAPAYFLASQRKRLTCWLAGLLAGTVLASAEAAAPPPEARTAPLPVAVSAPSGSGLKQAAKPVPAASRTAALPPARTEAAPGANAMVQTADGRLLAHDIARIVKRGELVVAMVGVDTPPFFFESAGTLSGLEVQMARELAHELKVKVRFDRSARSFNEVVEVVARQQADLGISKLSRTLARAQMVRFSDPYLTLNHAMVLNRLALAKVAADTPISQVVRNFKGSIGVLAKTSYADSAVRNFPQAEIRPYLAWPELIKAVSSGEVMSAYRDEFEIKQVLKSDPTFALTLRTVTFKDLEDSLGIAVGVTDTTLLAFVNQFLAQRKDKLDIKKVLQALDH